MSLVRNYEAIFVIDLDVGEENVKALVEKFKNLIETSAQLESIDEWGKRRLAYPINKKHDGYYVLANFSSGPDFPRELERNFKITDGILRYLVVKKD